MKKVQFLFCSWCDAALAVRLDASCYEMYVEAAQLSDSC